MLSAYIYTMVQSRSKIIAIEEAVEAGEIFAFTEHTPYAYVASEGNEDVISASEIFLVGTLTGVTTGA